MSNQSKLEDLKEVFDDLFFDSKIDGNDAMAYDISNNCIGCIRLNDDGSVNTWCATGPAANYQIQGLLAAMRYWWKVED